MLRNCVFTINNDVFKLYFGDAENYDNHFYHKIYLKLNDDYYYTNNKWSR